MTKLASGLAFFCSFWSLVIELMAIYRQAKSASRGKNYRNVPRRDSRELKTLRNASNSVEVPKVFSLLSEKH